MKNSQQKLKSFLEEKEFTESRSFFRKTVDANIMAWYINQVANE